MRQYPNRRYKISICIFLLCFAFQGNIQCSPWFRDDSEPFEYTDNSTVKAADDVDFPGFTSVVTYDKADSQDVDEDK